MVMHYIMVNRLHKNEKQGDKELILCHPFFIN